MLSTGTAQSWKGQFARFDSCARPPEHGLCGGAAEASCSERPEGSSHLFNTGLGEGHAHKLTRPGARPRRWTCLRFSRPCSRGEIHVAYHGCVARLLVPSICLGSLRGRLPFTHRTCKQKALAETEAARSCSTLSCPSVELRPKSGIQPVMQSLAHSLNHRRPLCSLCTTTLSLTHLPTHLLQQ